MKNEIHGKEGVVGISKSEDGVHWSAAQVMTPPPPPPLNREKEIDVQQR
jgi:hypothetical protein